MSDVRDELVRFFASTVARDPVMMAERLEERFEVTPKPVISDDELGRMMGRVYEGSSLSWSGKGETLRDLLEDAGLEIVRKEGS